MCIIVKKGAASGPITAQQRDWLHNCFANNHDGAGFMFRSNGGVHIVKGLMTVAAFEEAVAAHGRDGDGLTVFHFRQATHGKVCVENTHPFPLSASYAELGKTNIVTTTGIVHNGVLPVASDAEHSDTMNFVRAYLGPFKHLTTRILNLVALTGDKFVVLSANNLWTIGKFEEEAGDWSFSNLSYKATYTTLPNVHDAEWWEDVYGGSPKRQLGEGFCDNCGLEFGGGSAIHAESMGTQPDAKVCENCAELYFVEVGNDDYAAWEFDEVYLVNGRFGTFDSIGLS